MVSYEINQENNGLWWCGNLFKKTKNLECKISECEFSYLSMHLSNNMCNSIFY